ncbi:hypothetical protein NDU88_006590 [Pleurodeles waltl]|uniref:Uncharacterized protein n=1 Tax=Pleurodeles waltl TaxID=8319 RepID=A0AAV7PIS7_PLEWA|nr:hypothetical protein NDU88_006590 [Pleurodeles waltl]
MRFARRADASIRQRVLSRGRRASERSAMPGIGRVGVRQDFYPLHEGVPSTSRGTCVADQEVIDNVLLDYEEEDESEEVFSGHLRAVQSGTSRVVECEADKKAIQSDRWVGRDLQVSFAGNLPRGRYVAAYQLLGGIMMLKYFI